MRPVAASRRPARGFQKLGLTVAGDTGNADDLAGPEIETDLLDPGHAGPVDDGQVFDLEQGIARRGGRLLHAQQDLAADHHFGQLFLGGLRRRLGADHGAGAHDRHPVGHVHDLLQLVGDQQDRLTLFLEAAQNAEEVVGLLRRQDGGRLVEDQSLPRRGRAP